MQRGVRLGNGTNLPSPPQKRLSQRRGTGATRVPSDSRDHALQGLVLEQLDSLRSASADGHGVSRVE